MPLLFLGVFLVYQILLLFIHAVVYETVANSFGWNWPWLAWTLGVLSFSFVGASILAHKYYNRAIEWFYRISAYWFGLVLFLFLGCFISYVVMVMCYNSSYYISPAIIAGCSLGIVFLIHSYATWQTQRPKKTYASVSLKHLPKYWHNKKIAFVSDIHLGDSWDASFGKRVVDFIASEKPEVVLIGGDAFDGVTCPGEFFTEPFSKLHAPQGVYFASGNHEYIGENQEYFFAAIRKAGVRILANEKIDLQGIQVIGIDWKDTHKAKDCERILKGIAIDPAIPSILIKHEPNDLPVSQAAGISLQLSGHTHAGQIFPLSFITHRLYDGYDYGFKKLGEMMVGTSSGVGTWGPPLRFGTKSEIVIITLTA